jgi:hypothetical protein
MYMALESWRQELKIIELESLEAELTEDQIAEANQPNAPEAQSTIDVDVRSPFFGN